MKLYIPKISDILTLKEEWTFDVYSEFRNEKLGSALNLYEASNNKWLNQIKKYSTIISGKCTLPSETQLRVDRVYIRKGDSSEYNSLSFVIKNHPDKKFKNVRFWARLEDCNNMIIYDNQENI